MCVKGGNREEGRQRRVELVFAVIPNLVLRIRNFVAGFGSKEITRILIRNNYQKVRKSFTFIVMLEDFFVFLEGLHLKISIKHNVKVIKRCKTN